jgi:sporulation-control protein spo0M
MKKLLITVSFLLLGYLAFAQDNKNNKLEFPLVGKFEFRPTQYPQFKEIEFWVFDQAGKLHFYVNHATGTNMPKEKVMFSANEEYIQLMTKHGYELCLKRNKH